MNSLCKLTDDATLLYRALTEDKQIQKDLDVSVLWSEVRLMRFKEIGFKWL